MLLYTLIFAHFAHRLLHLPTRCIDAIDLIVEVVRESFTKRIDISHLQLLYLTCSSASALLLFGERYSQRYLLLPYLVVNVNALDLVDSLRFQMALVLIALMCAVVGLVLWVRVYLMLHDLQSESGRTDYQSSSLH